MGSKDPSKLHADEIYSLIFYFRGDNRPEKLKHIRFHCYYWFHELQHLITNNKMFWLLFSEFYTSDETSLNKAELEKQCRLNVSLEDRMQVLRKSERIYDGIGSGGVSLDYQRDRLSKYEDDDYITVYRSFSVQAKRRDENGKIVNGKIVRGKPVRKGITKLSEEGGVHMEGNGISYSFSKMQALKFARSINTYIIKKNCKVSDKEAKKILKGWVEEQYLDYVEMYGGFYREIGMFKVKKKDVLLCTNLMDEDELIANPKDVILVDYKFLNSIHFVATKMTIQIGKWASEKKLTAIENFDDIFDFVYDWVRSYEQQSDGFIAKYLDTRKRPKDFDTKLHQMFQKLVGESLGVGDDVGDANGIGVLENHLTGFKLVTFFDHLIWPQKKNRNLYQPRKFTFTKVKDPRGSVSQSKPKLNVLADSDGSQRTWYNQKK